MKLRDYIKALEKLAAELPDDAEVVVQRCSDYETVAEANEEIERDFVNFQMETKEPAFPRAITLVDERPTKAWLTRDHETLPNNLKAKRKRFVELSAGN